MANSDGARAYLGTPPPLAALAARQHGVVATRQLEALGHDGSAIAVRVRHGHLIRVYRGVYAVGHDRLTARGRWMAAVLACGGAALLSHRAAVALWGLRPATGGRIDVTAPGHSRRRVPGVRFHGARVIHPQDRATIDGIPVTSLARTLLDQAETLHLQRLRTLLEAAQRQDSFDFRAVQALLARSNGRRGVTKLRTALAQLTEQGPWTQSELERSFLELIREAGLPEPQTNVVVDGYVVDCFWPEHNLIVELDGYGFHNMRRPFEEDRRRDAAHTVAGRRTLRVTRQRIQHERRRLVAELSSLLPSGAASVARSGR